MSGNNKPLTKVPPKKDSFSIQPHITAKHLGVLFLIVVSFMAAMILLAAPDRLQLGVLFFFMAVIVSIYILFNPFAGVYLYLFMEFLRPQIYFSALAPLRLPMVIVVITLISWAIHLARTKTQIHWTKFTWVYLAFPIAIMISTISNDTSYGAFQSLMITFAIFVVATNIVNSLGRLKKLIWLLLLIHLLLALISLYSFSAGPKVSGVGTGLSIDENDFAMALNVMIPFAFFMFLYLRGTVKKAFALTILMVFIFGVISSFSRGGLVGLAAVLLYCVLKSKRKLVSLGLIFLLGVAAISFAPPSYWEEIRTIPDVNEATARSRLNFWSAAVKMYLDYPVAGVGADNGPWRMPEYLTGFKDLDGLPGFTFHGTIPQVMAELGSLGLGCYLIMLIMAVSQLNRVRKVWQAGVDNDFGRHMANALIGGIVAFLATGAFLSVAYYPQLWALYMLTFILLNCVNLAHTREIVGK